MCGIIGYIGERRASTFLIEGLKKLEYRGYDSVGIATVENGKIIVKKDVGKVNEVSERYDFSSTPGKIGIGHTRWATHGKVDKKNAHPHLSEDESVAVVHNGIIENYIEIKKFLASKGVRFLSETDTEVVPQMISFMMKKGLSFEEAVIKTLKGIKGSYALLILHKNEDKLIAARKDSPLVIGIAPHGFFAASDIPAFLKYTKRVVYLRDGDVAFLDFHSMRVYNIYTQKLEVRKVCEVPFDVGKIEKGKFAHYMIKEILEQAEILKKLEKTDLKPLKKAVEIIKKSRRMFFVAAGTSYHACIAGKYMFSKLTDIVPHVILASEFENFLPSLKKDDVVFAVSQSGETADVLRAVKLAKRKDVKTISLVNILGSSLTRISDVVIPMNAGIEIGVAATKTYTAELVNLSFLAHLFAGKENKVKRKIHYLQSVVYNLTSQTLRRLLYQLATKLKDKSHIFLIGRGLEYATAMEAALKIKEISYIHAEAFAGGELKHGPIALIEENAPVFVFVSKDNRNEILSNAEEVKSRGGYVIGVSSRKEKMFDFWIKTPEDEILNPVIQIIPMQILAYHLAVVRGLDPDKPRNLAKSVTVI